MVRLRLLQVELSDVVGLASVKRLERSTEHHERLQHHKEDEALRKRNADAVAAGAVVATVSRHFTDHQLCSWRWWLFLHSYLAGTGLPAAVNALSMGLTVTMLFVCCAGKPMEYFYRHLYLPQLGMFKALPQDLELGKFVEPATKPVALGYASDGGLIKDGVEYK